MSEDNKLMDDVRETIAFLEAAAAALKMFGGNSKIKNTIESILDRGTRYIRVADKANAGRGSFLQKGTEELVELVNETNANLLEEQRERIQARSTRIASKTAELEEQLGD